MQTEKTKLMELRAKLHLIRTNYARGKTNREQYRAQMQELYGKATTTSFNRLEQAIIEVPETETTTNDESRISLIN